MKTYTISGWTFAVVCLLILALPLSRKWKLIIRGEKAGGVVSAYRPVVKEHADDSKTLDYASEVLFRAGDSTYVARGPESIRYKQGRRVTVLYDPEDPGRNSILTFSALYLSDYSALPLVLLILWGAFYLSFNNYSRFARGRDPGAPAGSPRLPAGSRSSLRRLWRRLLRFK